AATAAPAQAATGAAMTAPPNKMKTILTKVAMFGAIGAAVGFGASFLPLPFIGGLAAPVIAAIGGGIGALVGLFVGNKQAAAEQAAYEQSTAAATAGPTPGATGGVTSATTPAGAPAPAGTTGPGEAEGVEPDGAPRPATYTVRKGDCLSTIADKYDLTWQDLYKANRTRVGPDPDLIHPGLRLSIPAA
ncbi:MAG: peptidoglycan-binding protein, partial [Thermoleophilia bacterium]|nr:peptidoglycan-binding protein [Thermoleophilia bacterium]